MFILSVAYYIILLHKSTVKSMNCIVVVSNCSKWPIKETDLNFLHNIWKASICLITYFLLSPHFNLGSLQIFSYTARVGKKKGHHWFLEFMVTSTLSWWLFQGQWLQLLLYRENRSSSLIDSLSKCTAIKIHYDPSSCSRQPV